MKKNLFVFVGLLIILPFFKACKQTSEELPLLKISENNRYFMDENNQAFFWLGDTGWLLFSKLSREEAEIYLEDRRNKGFNVIQAMVAHNVALCNYYGDSAFIAQDVSQPLTTPGNEASVPEEYDYWDHVDYIIRLAEKKGIYMALVPVWGSNVKSGKVSPKQASVYSRWLAERNAEKNNIIWLNGGDIRGSDSTAVWNIIGKNIRSAAPNHLITFHPFGRTRSAQWFHQASWLDFNMFQSGHRRYDQDDTETAYGQDNWKYIRDDYLLTPVKPTLDGEPSYEGIPQGLHDPAEPFWNDDDCRRYAYWSVFEGGCGFTYGHSAVMQMHKPGNEGGYGVREYWDTALNAPGAGQMKHLKKLILSFPFFERIPDPSLIAGEQKDRYNYLAATRGKTYALIYTYNGREMKINMNKIEGSRVKTSWFNPKTGSLESFGETRNTGIVTFNPPGEPKDGNDWVLVLESL